mmetsp:Transcript_7579/g.19243  ORF Transcript_7579/g.19243 Transcript_7579/m.19243 type:complete len:211 (-) Transcript_7579:883-1515(-)
MLMALRLGNASCFIRVQLPTPYLVIASSRISSSSCVHRTLQFSLSWPAPSCTRAQHSMAVRPGMCCATLDHLSRRAPYTSNSSNKRLCSSAVNGLRDSEVANFMNIWSDRRPSPQRAASTAQSGTSCCLAKLRRRCSSSGVQSRLRTFGFKVRWYRAKHRNAVRSPPIRAATASQLKPLCCVVSSSNALSSCFENAVVFRAGLTFCVKRK